MSELTDKEKMQVSAETASANRKKAASINIEDVLARIERWDGVGLTPSEVWCLYEHIKKLNSSFVDFAVDLILILLEVFV